MKYVIDAGDRAHVARWQEYERENHAKEQMRLEDERTPQTLYAPNRDSIAERKWLAGDEREIARWGQPPAARKDL